MFLNLPPLYPIPLGFSTAMADKEIGSVLIAINSYVNPRTYLKPLLNIDQAFADYIKAFYSHLFFHVEVLVDFSYKDLQEKLKSFAQNSVGSRIAAVFLCHGGLNLSGAECIFTNDAHPVLMVDIVNFFHMNCRDKNKYLFFDACRSDTSGDESTSRLVYKASVDKTFVVFSTLPFHKAYVGGSYSLWSYWFTQKIVNQMLLDNVVTSVDDAIRSEIREKLGITHKGQVSEVSKLGAVENPNLRSIAAAENQGRTRDLSVELDLFVTQMQKIMTEYRQSVYSYKYLYVCLFIVIYCPFLELSAVPVATTFGEPIGTSFASSLPQGKSCVCVYITHFLRCIVVYVYCCVCVYIHACMFEYMCDCARVCVCVRTCLHVCKQVCPCCVHVCVHACICVAQYAWVCACICMYM